MTRKVKPLKIKRTGFYKCEVCGGSGTAQGKHCGQLMVFVAPTPAKEKTS